MAQSFFRKEILVGNNIMNLVVLGLMCSIVLSSCGTSKAALELTKAPDYKMKQFNAEKVNSTYDNLIAEYLEDSKPKDIKEAEAFLKDTLAHMEKTSCLGRCPVYRVTIYNNGNAKYEGVAHVELEGIFQSKLDDKQKKELQSYLDKIEMLKLPNRFPRGVNIVADASVTKLLLSNGSFKFPFEINYGEPDEVKNFHLYLDRLILELSWVQI